MPVGSLLSENRGRPAIEPLTLGPMRPWLLIICILLVGCDVTLSGPSSANTPQEMFSHLIPSPIPPTITKLEGVGDTWQGYSLYLRFQAPDADIDRIITSGGFRPAAWSDTWRFSLPDGYDRFSTPWSPTSIATKECYVADVTNPWTHSGTHYLIIDRSTGNVYFYGIGA